MAKDWIVREIGQWRVLGAVLTVAGLCVAVLAIEFGPGALGGGVTIAVLGVFLRLLAGIWGTLERIARSDLLTTPVPPVERLSPRARSTGAGQSPAH